MSFQRKNIRLPSLHYRGRGCFFITLCCEQRRPVFSDCNKSHQLIDFLKAGAEKYSFGIQAFCVMPDHFHALAEGLAPESDLLLFVRNFKRQTSREYGKETGRQLWQKKFFDHILRSKDSPEAVSWYIWLNPVRKGLCKNFEEYPFSGSFTRHWKGLVETGLWMPPWKKPQMPA
jgi:putative transposase